MSNKILYLTKAEAYELKNSYKLHEFLDLYEDKDFDIYNSIEDFAKENSDGCEDDEPDYDYGKFLIEAYQYDGKFVFEFSSGRILVERD